MIVLIPLLVLAQTEPTITLDARVQRLDAVVESLERQTGRSLSVAPNLRREMVLVRAHGVPLDALLTRIAHCAYAEWVRDGARLRLERSIGAERRLADTERKLRATNLRRNFSALLENHYKSLYDPARSAQALRRQVDAWVSETKGNPFPRHVLQEDPNRSLPLTNGHPTKRALVRLAKHLDFETLAHLTEEDGLVFSTVPRDDQHPFSAPMQPALTQFRQDLAAYAKALKGWPGQEQVVGLESPDRITLRITRFKDDFMLRLHAYDRESREVATGMIDLTAEGTPPSEKFDAQGKLKLSPPSVAIEKAYDTFTRIRGLKGAMEWVRHSDRFPQLAFGWSELLPVLAPHSKAHVVANVEDVLEEQCPLSEDSVDLHKAALVLRQGHEIAKEGDWFVVRPRFPGPAGANRYDRERIAALGRIVADFLPLPIEDIVTPVPTPPTFRVIHGGHPLISHGWQRDSPGQVTLNADENTLHLLGALPFPRRIRLLRNGGTLAWSEFGPELQQVVTRLLLRSGSGTPTSHPRDMQGSASASEGPDEEIEGGEPQRRRQIIDATFYGGRLRENPVTGDLLSRETLRSVRLQITVKTEPGLVEKGETTPEFRLNPFTLRPASEVTFDVVPYLPQAGEEAEVSSSASSRAETYRPARVRSIQARLLLPRGYFVEFEAEDWAFDIKAPFVTSPKLPAALVREIQLIRDRDE